MTPATHYTTVAKRLTAGQRVQLRSLRGPGLASKVWRVSRVDPDGRVTLRAGNAFEFLRPDALVYALRPKPEN